MRLEELSLFATSLPLASRTDADSLGEETCSPREGRDNTRASILLIRDHAADRLLALRRRAQGES
jgi:hypothetical protein